MLRPRGNGAFNLCISPFFAASPEFPEGFGYNLAHELPDLARIAELINQISSTWCLYLPGVDLLNFSSEASAIDMGSIAMHSASFSASQRM